MLKEEKMAKPVSDSATAPDVTNQAALDYGAALVRLFGPRTWAEVAELGRNGWASRSAQAGDARQDWRLSWPTVKEGWQAAGGQLASASPDQQAQPTKPDPEPTRPAVGAFVFDAFGEPAGRVKVVRESDFLLGRPLRRDVYVPLSAIRRASAAAMRIDMPNAHVGANGWELSKPLGLFGGRA